MREELATKLRDRHPEIFSKGTYPECGDGWYGIIDSLCYGIQNHIRSREISRSWAERNKREGRATIPISDLIEQVVVEQIKEKFGTLRFYYSGGDDTVHGMATMAEIMSSGICEDCGNRAEVRNGSWVRTLCDQHHVKRSLGASDEFLR